MYKVVKEALKKIEKIHVVFFKLIVNTHEMVAKTKRLMRYKRLSIIGEIPIYFHKNCKTIFYSNTVMPFSYFACDEKVNII